jgi:hypothetical protein
MILKITGTLKEELCAREKRERKQQNEVSKIEHN